MNTRNIILATAITALAACSSAPERNLALDQAQTRFNSAQSNSQVSSLATQELTQARKALNAAQVAWEEKEDKATVNHLAYLASQHITIAQATASSLSAQATTKTASAERDKLLLNVRTSEADRAQQRANDSEQRSEQALEALATAKTDAAETAETAQERERKILDLETSLKELNAKKTDRGMVLTLGDVLFNTGKAEISASAAPNMNKLANFLNRYPEQRASIEGYTDNTGTEAGNYALSQRRASAVQAALVNQGVQRTQLSTQAHGQENPIADNNTAVGRQLNRRVEIVFEPMAEEVSAIR